MKKQYFYIHRWLIGLLLLALILRLILSFAALIDGGGNFTDPDSREYIKLADNLLSTGAYELKGVSEINRVPGYPCFILPMRWLFPHCVFPIILFQVIIDTANCWLLWLLVRRIHSDSRIALLAVGFQAVSVVAIVYANKVLSETIYTFILLLTLLMFEMIRKPAGEEDSRNWWLSALTGVACGISTLVRAVTMPVLPLFGLYVWFRSRKLVMTGVFTVCLLVILGIWFCRNYFVVDYAGVCSVSSTNLYRYNACMVLAKRNGVSFSEQQNRLDAEIENITDPAERASCLKSKAVEVILQSPFTYGYLHLKSDVTNLLPAIGNVFQMTGCEIGQSGTLSVINTQGIFAGIKHYFRGRYWLLFLALPAVILLGIKYLAAIMAGVYVCLKDRKIVFFLYFILIAYFLLVPGPASLPRFRVPVSPLLSFFAGWGIILAWDWMLCLMNRRKE
jgi:hypothetical protein